MTRRRDNIAHILPWPSVGGTEHATLRLARAVAPRYQSKVFCLEDATNVRNLFSDQGFETFSYQPIVPSYRRMNTFLRDSYRLAREFKRHEIDVIHCADVLAAYHAAVAGRIAGLPVLCHVRNRYADLATRDAIFLRAVSKFIFVSRDTRQTFRMRLPARRTEIIYDGISISPTANDQRAMNEARDAVRAEFGLPAHTKLVGMVARVAAQKDYETLAKAAARIAPAHPDLRFMIVGDNSLEAVHRDHYEKVMSMLTSLGVESRFVFTGFRADVSRMIAAFDVFVLSTHFEGFPLVILEALAHQKPVVATAVDGIPEIIVNDETGLLAQPRNDHALAAQIDVVLRSAELARRLGAAGRETVERNFSSERFAESVLNLYDRVTDEKSLSASRPTTESLQNLPAPKTMTSE